SVTRRGNPHGPRIRMWTMGSSSIESRWPDDGGLVCRLRSGDELAFVDVVRRCSPVMLRVARGFVSDGAAAQDVVQEAWLAVVRGLDRFEGRSSLRTWILAITANL